ncbi:MAG: M28 family peptidase [Candidatus Thorarchaeota archaeon]
MKRLWVFVFLGLMMMIPPVYSIETTTQTHSAVAADFQSSSSIPRVYGENIASQIYFDVTFSQYRDLVRKFSENGSRYILDFTMTDRGANLASRNYLIQELQSLSNGRIEVETVGEYYNVVGRLPGYLPGDNPVIAVSAHYDSPQNSPGANGDGSGIAAVLSLARMLSKYEWPLDIYFIAFNGLYTLDFMSGSPEVASKFQSENIDILTLYNIDRLLVPNPDADPDERLEIGYIDGGQQNYHKSQYWAESIRMMSNNYGSNYIVPVRSSSFPLWQGSDHYSFYERGFTNLVCASQSGHAFDGTTGTTTDFWNNDDFNHNLGRETTAAIGANIAFTMSRRYGSPITIQHTLSNAPGRFEMLYFCVTTPTIVNISARWFGGTSTFYLLDPDFHVMGASAAYNHTSAWVPTEIFSRQLTTKGIYAFAAHNTDIEPVGYDIKITYESDIDGNGVLDNEEYWLDQSYFESDQDDDGISDAEEIFLGTDMNSIDSDSDTMPDKYEVDMGFDPTDASDANEDADSDGLTNSQEYSGGLNPLSADSDGDLMDDLWELTYGLNPLNPDDAILDLDGDTISNLDEYLAGTDPTISDVEPVSLMLYVAPVIVIAPIVGLLYVWRRNRVSMS